MNKKVERLIGWAKGRQEPPVAIELIPTNLCNFKCLTCWQRGAVVKTDDEMTDERLLQLIDEAHDLGVLEIAFVGGGEPLMRPITVKLIERILGYGMECDLVTNGSLLREEDIEMFVKKGLTRIKFSIDGSTPELQNRLRGSKSYDKVIGNIRKLNDAKRKHKSSLPRIIFNTVVSKENFRDLPGIVTLGAGMGLNEILLLPMTVFSEAGKEMKMSHAEMLEFCDVIRQTVPLLKRHNIYSNMERFIDLRYVENTNDMGGVIMEEAEKALIRQKLDRGEELISGKKDDALENFMTLPCFDPWHHMTIIANGNIAACFNKYVWETDVTIKDHTLRELWYGEYFGKYRRQLLSRTLPDACKTCCVWKVFENEKIRKEMEGLAKG